MKTGDYIFVYGTLRKGERADLSTHSHKFCVEFIGKDEVNGKLYHLGSFPGLKLLPAIELGTFDTSSPCIVGEVFVVTHPAIGALLDAYEGYRADNPSQGLYDRTQVLTRSGRIVWVYVYNPMVTDDQLIETGDWKNPRLAETRKIPVYSRRERK